MNLVQASKERAPGKMFSCIKCTASMVITHEKSIEIQNLIKTGYDFGICEKGGSHDLQEAKIQ